MRVFVFFVLIFCSDFLFAQNSIIRGVVTNADGGFLSGVSVLLPPSQRGTSTDAGGAFTLKKLRPETVYTLRFSYVGYKTVLKSVKTTDNSVVEIQVVLTPELASLDEVVVSFDRIQAVKESTSLPIEVVNDAFIGKYLSGSLMKSLSRLPGLTTIDIGAGQSKPIIRGLSFNRVLVVEQGVRHEAQQWGADHGLEIDQYAVEDIEILKGPSSLAFGSEAVGGVINIKPAAFPIPHSLDGEISSSYMSNNRSMSGSLKLNGRHTHWMGGVQLTYVRYADYRTPADAVNIYNLVVPLHKNRLRNTAGIEQNLHAKVGYVSKKFNSVLYGSYFSVRSGFFANAHGMEPRRVDNAFHDRSDLDIQKPLQRVKHYKIINITEFFRDKHHIKINTGFQRNVRWEENNYVRHGFMPAVFPSDIHISEDLERGFQKNHYSFKIQDEILFKKYQFTFGAELGYQENDISGWGFIIPKYSRFDAGIFALGRYEIQKDMLLNGGLRYDYAGVNINSYNDWFLSENKKGQKSYLQRVADFDKKFRNLSFSAGINYNPNKLTLKANLGSSFRIPQAKELAANGVNYHYFRYEKGDKNLSVERAYQLDVSAEWHQKRWAIQFSPFVNYFPNYIYLNPTPTFDYLYGAGNQVFEYTENQVFRVGMEAHAHLNLTKKLQLGVVADYVRSRQLSGDKKGYSLPFSPPFSMIFNLKYKFKSLKKIMHPYVAADYKFTGSQHNIVPPEEITAAYRLLDISAGTDFKLSGYLITLSGQIKNVFNTKYFNHTSFYRLIDLPEQGRNVIVSLKIHF